MGFENFPNPSRSTRSGAFNFKELDHDDNTTIEQGQCSTDDDEEPEEESDEAPSGANNPPFIFIPISIEKTEEYNPDLITKTQNCLQA
ncbi:hypothetical protein CCACVL1_20423 [Corchorus capsularis]|uniref:Uncharacterized protein n=1 Tax=Corchorus capsularis TaxID=210143 RepID=A0A1R3HBB4_COCAP|nr:hypothetical protein CCACVL1_20423 [Corchorus capsularis]